MTRRYQGSNHPWTAILMGDPTHPIPTEWVLELSRSFIGDLMTNVPHTGALISSIHCSWQVQLPIFEKFSLPIWVRFPQNSTTAVDVSLPHYILSSAAIAQANEAVQLEQTPDTWGQADNMWGPPDDSMWGRPEDKPQSIFKWDDGSFGLDSLFRIPQPHSRQKQGEDWKAFFAWHRQENKRKEETETPAQWQSRQNHERAAMNHSIPGKSSTAVMFEWQPDAEFGGFCQCIRLTKAEVSMTWMSYSKSTRVYDLFRNEWDLCDVLDPTSVPNGDWEEDNFDFLPAPAPSEPDLAFERHRSLLWSFIERFVSILHFHLGYHLAASTTTPQGRSTTFDDWTHKTQWSHLCKLVGNNPMNITSIPDIQKNVITCFIGYLITLPESQLADILPDLWDLRPDSSLSVSNPHMRVSYVQQPKQRLYIIESPSPHLVPWKLAVPDPIMAVMCLRCDWGSDIIDIVHHLLEKGITIKTLQLISVLPHA
ncbi:hypothetical protein EV702DRAFT_1192948 [Suillus placidus]|uniref:Uncharacterized protein n=1 Tax=Suillus placidus TaxID=48579 RepID=A0A9P7D7J7_9AGAM|nr:hypothetical protein EV702DRAFT_1192948 [Suillus placidus]